MRSRIFREIMIKESDYKVDSSILKNELILNGKIIVHYPKNNTTMSSGGNLLDIVNRFLKENPQFVSKYMRDADPNKPGWWEIS